jgi:hypothetical protein
VPATEDLWQNFCRLRLQSRAYRAVDDPAVACAYNDWLAQYLSDSEKPMKSTVVQFRPRKISGARKVSTMPSTNPPLSNGGAVE